MGQLRLYIHPCRVSRNKHLGAAKLGWIDGIMFTYNYRVMYTERMKKAVNDSFKAGIGLTAMDNKKLSVHDIDYLKQYARETASNYCTGCAYVCEPIMNNQVPISDVMRYLMYSRCYGDHERAQMAFIELPSEVRRRMGDINYDDAERKCPNKLPIGQLMREAVIEFFYKTANFQITPATAPKGTR